MRESVGSPGTEKETVETPAAWRALTRGAARSGEAPVTRRARRPMDRAAAGTCWRVPSPKRMRAAVANSKVGMGVRAPYPVGQTLGQGRKTNPGSRSRKPGTDGTASEFSAKGAGNPWQSRQSPEGTVAGGTVFHEVSRAEGPSQQTTKSDGLSYMGKCKGGSN